MKKLLSLGIPGRQGGRDCGEADAVLCGRIGILRTTIHLLTGAHIVNGLVLLCLNNRGVIDRAIHECTGYLHYSFSKESPIWGGTSPMQNSPWLHKTWCIKSITS